MLNGEMMKALGAVLTGFSLGFLFFVVLFMEYLPIDSNKGMAECVLIFLVIMIVGILCLGVQT